MPALILIVEDDTNAREGLKDFLEYEGLLVRGAVSADEALTIAIETPPAAVVTDIQLPGTSGFDLAEMLRLRPETRDVLVIGLTGHWSPEISSRAARAGMVAILMKPCLPAHLLAELRRLLSQEGQPPYLY
jgi:two-component system, OmpR family, response regulator